MPKASVIIINYNGRDCTIDCLKALERQVFRDFHAIVVDNNSTDDSLARIQEFLEAEPLSVPIDVVPLDTNTGFAGGNVVGLTYTQSMYVALLNNDTEPHEDWLLNLVRAMEAHPDVGICASRMIDSTSDVIDSAGDGFATSLKGFKRGEGMDRGNYNVQEYVFGACAGAALYRRAMIDEIGFFDEDFFLIHEDTDLNFRAQLAGWKVIYVPSALVYHKVRSTIGHMSDLAVYYTLRNSEFVRIKNIPFRLFLRCLPGFFLGTLFEFFYFALKHGEIGLFIRAKGDVIRNLKNMLAKRRTVMNMKRADDSYLYSIMIPVFTEEFFSAKARKLFFG